ncbi:methyltransferase family protein [Eubacteriales bacterium KG127]
MKKNHMPVFGVGPIYVITCLIITIIGYTMSKTSILINGNLPKLSLISLIIGLALIVLGIGLWIYAVIIQKITNEIRKGQLLKSGVYSIVRNPIYSAFLLIFTGVLVSTHNIFLLGAPILFYIALTFLMKATEEKWLSEKFGDEYKDYCNQVNRVIPWFKVRKNSHK